MQIHLKYLCLFYLTVFIFTSSNLHSQSSADKLAATNDTEAQNFLTEDNKAEAARIYNQTAYAYRIEGYNIKSIEYYKKVLQLNKELGNSVGQMLTHGNLSMLYIESEQFNEALVQLESELSYRQKSKNPREITPVIITLARVKNELDLFSEAIGHAEQAINMSLEANDLQLLKRSHGIAYDIYSKWGKSEKAQASFVQYSAIDKRLKDLKMAEVETKATAKVNEANFEKDKTTQELNVTNQELEKTVVNLEEAERVAQQQEMELDLQQSQINEQQALLKVEKLKKRYFALAFSITLLFVLALIFMFVRIRSANKKINDQKEKLEKQNREIRASIRYAETIQTAMLPETKGISSFASHFVIYRPKDIVSGDFYWSTIESESRMYYAVVDCTGHGVPGAFMSMIGIRMLNEIVNEMHIDSPASILETLNELLREALRQEQTDNNDGMDVAICRIDKNSNGDVELTYSGAKRPLYIGKKAKMDLEVYNPDRKSIGGYQPTKRYIEFTDHTIRLDKGDAIYLFSDGIVDQNDPYRKKFGRARLENILRSCIDEEAEEQCKKIEDKLDAFMQDQAQRDDITFSGLIIR